MILFSLKFGFVNAKACVCPKACMAGLCGKSIRKQSTEPSFTTNNTKIMQKLKKAQDGKKVIEIGIAILISFQNLLKSFWKCIKHQLRCLVRKKKTQQQHTNKPTHNLCANKSTKRTNGYLAAQTVVPCEEETS